MQLTTNQTGVPFAWKYTIAGAWSWVLRMESRSRKECMQVDRAVWWAWVIRELTASDRTSFVLPSTNEAHSEGQLKFRHQIWYHLLSFQLQIFPFMETEKWVKVVWYDHCFLGQMMEKTVIMQCQRLLISNFDRPNFIVSIRVDNVSSYFR